MPATQFTASHGGKLPSNLKNTRLQPASVQTSSAAPGPCGRCYAGVNTKTYTLHPEVHFTYRYTFHPEIHFFPTLNMEMLELLN